MTGAALLHTVLPWLGAVAAVLSSITFLAGLLPRLRSKRLGFGLLGLLLSPLPWLLNDTLVELRSPLLTCTGPVFTVNLRSTSRGHYRDVTLQTPDGVRSPFVWHPTSVLPERGMLVRATVLAWAPREARALTVLSGPDRGFTFTSTPEIEPDILLLSFYPLGAVAFYASWRKARKRSAGRQP